MPILFPPTIANILCIFNHYGWQAVFTVAILTKLIVQTCTRNILGLNPKTLSDACCVLFLVWQLPNHPCQKLGKKTLFHIKRNLEFIYKILETTTCFTSAAIFFFNTAELFLCCLWCWLIKLNRQAGQVGEIYQSLKTSTKYSISSTSCYERTSKLEWEILSTQSSMPWIRL